MGSYSFKIGITGLLFSTFAGNSYAQEFSLERQLEAFKANPKAYMSDHKNVQKYIQNYEPVEFDKETQEPTEWKFTSESELSADSSSSEMTTKFSPESIETKAYVDQKNYYHEGFQKKTEDLIREGRAQIAPNDRAEDLIGKLHKTKIQDMDRSYRSGKVANSPWSSDYWPVFKGGIARRYADPNFPSPPNWKSTHDYVLSNLFSPEVNSSSVQGLSPAEKYDLLVGDSNYSLTKAVLAEGFVGVERWMGICNGWAAASYMDKRPSQTIDVLAADKRTKIRFFPSDIKALLSLLWTKVSYPTKFIGTRCRIKNPDVDPTNGRVRDPSCFDTNPGTWHLAVVNQIGVNKGSFIFDATYDYEVWNQPAHSYQYTYFNPKTKQPVTRLQDAIVSLSDPEFRDTFQQYRKNPNAVSVVGISMKFVYVGETLPTGPTAKNPKPLDAWGFDRHVAVNYQYDLELDESGNILGGEWYHQQHPDFLWAPAIQALDVRSVGDNYLASTNDRSHWSNRQHNPVPKSWQEAAPKSSQYRQPLARVVRELLQKSNQTRFLGLRINWPGSHRE